jgi:Zn finger protein HypA/HybF involved in hydrogenase expression
MKSNKCKSCGYEWQPRKATVKECPRCKSRYWHLDRPPEEVVTAVEKLLAKADAK